MTLYWTCGRRPFLESSREWLFGNVGANLWKANLKAVGVQNPGERGGVVTRPEAEVVTRPEAERVVSSSAAPMTATVSAVTEGRRCRGLEPVVAQDVDGGLNCGPHLPRVDVRRSDVVADLVREAARVTA